MEASSNQLSGFFDCVHSEHMVRSMRTGRRSALGYSFVALPCLRSNIPIRFQPVATCNTNRSDNPHGARPIVQPFLLERVTLSEIQMADLQTWCNYRYLRCARVVALAAYATTAACDDDDDDDDPLVRQAVNEPASTIELFICPIIPSLLLAVWE
jgi:hypothetical protein